MSRVHLPADHNHTVACYKRTLLEAFPCDARAAIALHRTVSDRASLALFVSIWLLITGACLLLVWLQI